MENVNAVYEDVEIRVGSSLSDEEEEGTEKVDAVGRVLEGDKWVPRDNTKFKKVWMSAEPLTDWKSYQNWLLRAVQQVKILAVKPIMILRHRQKSDGGSTDQSSPLGMRGLTSNLLIFDVDCVYL